MMRILFPVLLTLSGCAVLLWLGTWQLQRLAWKEGVLAELDAQIAAAPVALPESPDPATDNYRAVTLDGRTTGAELHVLDSGTAAGTGYRVIAAFETDGRAVMLDLGLMPVEARGTAPTPQEMIVTGNLIWPDDVHASTPAPDLAENIWFGREVKPMAEALGTEPVMIVARATTPADPRTTLLPVGTGNIKNDHWEYAVTWFGLAAVWAVMGVALIRRTLKKDA